MVDLETMGNHSNSCIISIGALEFNLDTGETGREFYQNVDLQSCLNAGFTVDASTIYWWLQQSTAARLSLFNKESSDIDTVLHLFNMFTNSDEIIWGNSARFDLGILENAYAKTGIDKHWNYYNERDVRTLVMFAPEIKQNYPRTSIAHNALADCYHQVGYCSAIWQAIQQSKLSTK